VSRTGSAIAGGAAVLRSGLAISIAGEVTTAPMTRLPLVLIPACLVPSFTMLHLIALFQAHRLTASGGQRLRASRCSASFVRVEAQPGKYDQLVEFLRWTGEASRAEPSTHRQH
jgi:hypothetical protein